MNGQQPPMGGPAPAPRQGMYGVHPEPHRGTLIIIFGICGFAVCAVFGIAAWIMGSSDLKKIKAGTMDPAGLSNTRTGRLLGILSTVFSFVVFGLAILGMVFYLFLGAERAYHDAPAQQSAPAEMPTPPKRPDPPPRPVEVDLP